MSFRRVLTGVVLIAALAACGHNAQNSQNAGSSNGIVQNGTAASPAADTTPVGASSAGNGSSMEGAGTLGSGASGPAAAVPANMNCGSDQPVWVNKRSHVYHEPSDPLYGRTKHGAYMCPAAAISAGYHKATAHHHWKGANQPSPAGT